MPGSAGSDGITRWMLQDLTYPLFSCVTCNSVHHHEFSKAQAKELIGLVEGVVCGVPA